MATPIRNFLPGNTQPQYSPKNQTGQQKYSKRVKIQDKDLKIDFMNMIQVPKKKMIKYTKTQTNSGRE